MQTDETDESLSKEEIDGLLYGSTFERISETHVLEAVFERLPYSLARRFKALYFQFSPEEIEQATDYCFQFEDLLALSDRSIQNLLLSVPAETLAPAISGTSEEFRQRILENITRTKAEAIEEAIDQDFDIMTVTAARDDVLRPLEIKVHRQLNKLQAEEAERSKE
tara:strand:- start:61 stop:558 length:498 start_codon:yes stop_codon:yes gene_type:complete